MSTLSLRIERFRYKKIALTHTILIAFTLLAIILWQFERMKAVERTPHNVAQTNYCPPPPSVQYRMNNYKFTKPLLLGEPITSQDVNDSRLADVKMGINTIIDKFKSEGVLNSASVYLRELNGRGYLSIHDNEDFHPASMLKVPLMMTILRQSEVNPGFLNKVVNVPQLPQEGSGFTRKQDFMGGKILEAGKNYTVKDLLYYMVVESDNSAALLLERMRDENIYNALFNTLGLSSPYEGPNQGVYYTITAHEYSRFMRVLYNATYLSNENADFALSLLAKSEFKEGILKDLPSDVLASHKFGEFGWEQNGKAIRDYELHESAIIYLKDSPIVLTIMTKGKNKKDLAPVIAEIAKYVCEKEVKPAS